MPLYNGAVFNLKYPKKLEENALYYLKECKADIILQKDQEIEFKIVDITINPFKIRDEIVISKMKLKRVQLLTKTRVGEVVPLENLIEELSD